MRGTSYYDSLQVAVDSSIRKLDFKSLNHKFSISPFKQSFRRTLGEVKLLKQLASEDLSQQGNEKHTLVIELPSWELSYIYSPLPKHV